MNDFGGGESFFLDLGGGEQRLTVVLVSDVHKRLDRVRQLVEWFARDEDAGGCRAPMADVLLCAGDLAQRVVAEGADADAAASAAASADMSVVLAALENVCARLVYVPGNHDAPCAFAAPPPALTLHACNAHGRHVRVLPGLVVVGLGGSAPAVSAGQPVRWSAYPFPDDAALAAALASALASPGAPLPSCGQDGHRQDEMNMEQKGQKEHQESEEQKQEQEEREREMDHEEEEEEEAEEEERRRIVQSAVGAQSPMISRRRVKRAGRRRDQKEEEEDIEINQSLGTVPHVVERAEERLDVTRDFAVLLTHAGPDTSQTSVDCTGAAPIAAGSAAVGRAIAAGAHVFGLAVHGHTHSGRGTATLARGTLVVNPGALCDGHFAVCTLVRRPDASRWAVESLLLHTLPPLPASDQLRF